MPQFNFSSGALCTDFANTWGNRADPSTERLAGYGDLLEWSQDAEILSAGELRELEGLANWEPARAKGMFGVALELRDSVYRSCAAAAAGGTPSTSDIEWLNRVLSTIPLRRLRCGGECCEWEWEPQQLDLDRVLWPVVRSAADLLTSGDVGRLRECAAPDCTWLFVDHSRGKRRRWCDMSTCGNRAKARRYYERHRKSEGTTAGS
jgi:predicted RNA-binding Zn ribbon-like protein